MGEGEEDNQGVGESKLSLILLLRTGGFSPMVCQEWASPIWYYNSGDSFVPRAR
jgi:hypothetical protein